MTHWAKFDQCLADVTEQGERSAPGFERCFDRFVYEMKTAQRFYLPDAATVLIDGRRYDDFKDLLRLPYPSIALLSETSQVDTGRNGLKITLAIDSSAEQKTVWHLFSANNLPGHIQDRPEWLMTPIVPMVVFVPPSGGLPHGLVKMPETYRMLQASDRTEAQWVAEFQDDLAAITTLCIMLNSVNVKVGAVAAPARLNAKREKSGKPPLYSYHVLDVDGERWERPENDAPSESAGVRSHLRRGHIRRLTKGPTWVRAAYVHGSRDGFIDKDYNVKKKP